jgi:CheY-like chemotaxis protein
MSVDTSFTKNTCTKFLVVDDNNLDFEKITRSFARLKIENEILRAHDGVEALEILRDERPDTSLKPPYIVLLDLNMPRMSGIEFLAEIRADKRLSSTPVFILTTSDHPDDILKAHNFNVSGYIIKPVQKEQMQEALSALNMFCSLCKYPTSQG